MKRKIISGILLMLFLAGIMPSMTPFAYATENPSITVTVRMALTVTYQNIDDFELIMEGTGVGTFTMVGDFSDSGKITETFEVELDLMSGYGEAKGMKYLDGSYGKIVASFEGGIQPHPYIAGASLVIGEWTIMSGTGSYKYVRGEGTFRTELYADLTLMGVYVGLYD